MNRAIHSSIELLNRLRLLDADDWRLAIFQDLQTVVCEEKEVRSLFSCDISAPSDGSLGNLVDAFYKEHQVDRGNISEEEFLQIEEGLSEDKDLLMANELDDILEFCGEGRMKLVDGITPGILTNGAETTLTEADAFASRGVFSFDAGADPEIRGLQRGWVEDTVPSSENPYTWKDFLSRPVPTSQSAIINDRYIFLAREVKEEFLHKSGAGQIAILLNQIIPDNYTGTYRVSVFFEADVLHDSTQISLLESLGRDESRLRRDLNSPKPLDETVVQTIKDRIKNTQDQKNAVKARMKQHLSECLLMTSNYIMEALKYKDVQLEFVAVKHPSREYNRPDERYPAPEWNAMQNSWRDLHNHTHDRTVITSYYRIMASAQLNVSREDYDTKELVAARRQHVELNTLFFGANNPDQNRFSLPYFSMKRWTDNCRDFLAAAPTFGYDCFRYGKDNEGQPCMQEIAADQILTNPLL